MSRLASSDSDFMEMTDLFARVMSLKSSTVNLPQLQNIDPRNLRSIVDMMKAIHRSLQRARDEFYLVFYDVVSLVENHRETNPARCLKAVKGLRAAVLDRLEAVNQLQLAVSRLYTRVQKARTESKRVCSAAGEQRMAN
ncbi:hypothetical protein HDU97_000783, partial [Phlyctochytrium planicorne]